MISLKDPLQWDSPVVIAPYSDNEKVILFSDLIRHAKENRVPIERILRIADQYLPKRNKLILANLMCESILIALLIHINEYVEIKQVLDDNRAILEEFDSMAMPTFPPMPSVLDKISQLTEQPYMFDCLCAVHSTRTLNPSALTTFQSCSNGLRIFYNADKDRVKQINLDILSLIC